MRKIADESYEVALKHIRDNREAIDYIVDELVEKETITGEVHVCERYVDSKIRWSAALSRAAMLFSDRDCKCCRSSATS